MKTLKNKQIKKLAKVVSQMKGQKIPLMDLWFLGGGQNMAQVDKELKDKGIEIK